MRRHYPSALEQMGEGAFLLPLGGREPAGFVEDIGAACEAEGIEAEAIVGDGTVLVRLAPAHPWWPCFPPGELDRLGALCRAVLASSGLPGQGGQGGRGEEVVIPVRYDGPDLAEVAALCSMEPAEVVRRHQESRHVVDFMGFSPGFAYLGGLDQALSVPRLASPRPKVPPGSVAIADGRSCVYPSGSPGGWRIIARTDAVMFDPSRDPPSLLTPGTSVRFRAVEALGVPPGPAPALEGSGETSLSISQVSGLATVQDLGRPGWGAIGVPRAGALDAFAAVCANRLVGNPDGSAGIELVMGSMRLRAQRRVVVAVAGAQRRLSVASEGREKQVPIGCGFTLAAGEELFVGPARAGCVSFVALGGGVEAGEVMGSRSTDTLSGLGPPRLSDGALLRLGEAAAGVRPGRWLRSGSLPPGYPGGRPVPGAQRLRLVGFGPGADRPGLEALSEGIWQVGSESDRTGMRLGRPGGEKGLEGGGQSAPVGVVEGVVQLPEGGDPIVLRANHATTGGYRIVAVLAAADRPKAAQLRPGDLVRFDLLDPSGAKAACEEARRAWPGAVCDLGQL